MLLSVCRILVDARVPVPTFRWSGRIQRKRLWLTQHLRVLSSVPDVTKCSTTFPDKVFFSQQAFRSEDILRAGALFLRRCVHQGYPLSLKQPSQLHFSKIAQHLLFAFIMSDRDGSGRTGRQPTSEDVRRLLLTWLQEWCRNDSTFHDDDPMRYFSQRRPGLPRAITDFVSANPHPILSTALSTPTPTKRSEAEGTLPTSTGRTCE